MYKILLFSFFWTRCTLYTCTLYVVAVSALTLLVGHQFQQCTKYFLYICGYHQVFELLGGGRVEPLSSLPNSPSNSEIIPPLSLFGLASRH